MRNDFDHMTPADYYVAVLRALAALRYGPVRKITPNDAAAYHKYGHSPEQAAEIWAQHKLYADQSEMS